MTGLSEYEPGQMGRKPRLPRSLIRGWVGSLGEGRASGTGLRL